MSDRLVLIFMIDALGFEEAGNPSFLPQLERPRAPVRSVLGYSSAAIPTIMSGELPDRHGHFSMYRRSPGDGVFHGIAPFLRLAGRMTDRRWRLSRWITRYLRFRGVTGYFSLYEIPLELLPEFDLCQRRNLYRPRAFPGRKGLADFASGVPSRIWGWDVPEERAFAELDEELDRGDKRVLFLYTADLDATMHAAGPASEATRARLRGYESRIAAAVARARSRYREVRVFVFGDHGMAPVRAAHDLTAPLASIGLRAPRDWLYFLDSTMARFWFRSPQAARRVEDLLGAADYGRWIPPEELSKLGAFFPQSDYGERIFLLREGQILVPSFMSRQPVRGMHGYHPDDRHSYTTLLTNAGDVSYPGDLIGLHALLRSEIARAAA